MHRRAFRVRACKALGLDLGNVNAFLKDDAVERVSLENATRIMKYLCEV